ncbi:hypothetical protein [Streptomyces sp. Agncl-13]
MYAKIFGDGARATTLVLVEEVADAGWGIGGVLTLAKIQGTPQQ